MSDDEKDWERDGRAGTPGDPSKDARLTAYVLEELAPEERGRFERELAARPELAEEVRALEGLSADLRRTLGASIPAALDEARRTALLGAARELEPRPSRGWPRKLSVALAAAALFLVVGGVAWMSFRGLRGEWSTAGKARARLTAATMPTDEFQGLKGLAYVGDPEDGSSRAPGSSPGSCTFSGGSAGPLRRDEIWPTGNTESYDPISESGFHDPRRQPLSTFAIDVDTASYANVRRFLSRGLLPPADAVRIEELVNAFRYDLPEPRGSAPLAVHVDDASAPWEPTHRLVRVALTGRAPDRERPLRKNLVFLVDVSGSMDAPEKLPLVQRSLRLLVDELANEDRVALVVYAGHSGVELPSTPVSERKRILEAIDELRASGSTNGGSGIQLAYSEALEHFQPEGVNRVVLATDGDFNVGLTDRASLLELIESRARSGVFLSVLGFGIGNLRDGTLEQLADHGNGNYAYLDTLAEARKVLVRELDATLETVAKDVKIQVEFNPARVSAWRLVGYENRALASHEFQDDRKDAGELGAGQEVTALYEVVRIGDSPEPSALRYRHTVPDPAPTERDGEDPRARELLTVAVRYKAPDADASRLLSVPFVDSGASFEDAAADLRFAAAVAAFGQCLRDSPLRGHATLADVMRWAAGALGSDPDGDRREFLRLVDVAAGLSGR